MAILAAGGDGELVYGPDVMHSVEAGTSATSSADQFSYV
jgi:hypothetical protein